MKTIFCLTEYSKDASFIRQDLFASIEGITRNLKQKGIYQILVKVPDNMKGEYIISEEVMNQLYSDFKDNAEPCIFYGNVHSPFWEMLGFDIFMFKISPVVVND